MDKHTGRVMSILMGLTMSFMLSLLGMVSAGTFTLPGFLKSFLISFLIATAIGLLIPVRKIAGTLAKKSGAAPGSVKGRVIEALATDLMYSPLMTFIMVYMAYRQATAHGAKIPFGGMLLKSEIISFIAAFLLSYLLPPVFVKLLTKKK